MSDKSDKKKLLEKYDTNGDGVLSKEEIKALTKDFETNKLDKETIAVIKKFDSNGDGVLDDNEVTVLRHELDLNESSARFAGYSFSLARLFRYLAFTSDFGEAMRPVVSARIVNGSYAVAIGNYFQN